MSEALYLHDPDGIGIELYFDQPREQWPWHGHQISMISEPLDTATLLEDLAEDAEPQQRIPPDTVIGHVHLQVSSLERAEAFYAGLLQLNVMQRDYEGALFLASGAYHHHLAVNIWNSEGGRAPPTNAVGLRDFTLTVSDRESLLEARNRLEKSDADLEFTTGDGLRAIDPDGSVVELVVRSAI